MFGLALRHDGQCSFGCGSRPSTLSGRPGRQAINPCSILICVIALGACHDRKNNVKRKRTFVTLREPGAIGLSILRGRLGLKVDKTNDSTEECTMARSAEVVNLRSSRSTRLDNPRIAT